MEYLHACFFLHVFFLFLEYAVVSITDSRKLRSLPLIPLAALAVFASGISLDLGLRSPLGTQACRELAMRLAPPIYCALSGTAAGWGLAERAPLRAAGGLMALPLLAFLIFFFTPGEPVLPIPESITIGLILAYALASVVLMALPRRRNAHADGP